MGRIVYGENKMRLIIGGTGQGKLAYANEHYAGEIIIDKIHEMIWQDMQENPDGEVAFFEEKWKATFDGMMESMPMLCFICDEVGMGIVPMTKLERNYREVVGHVCTYLAEKAESVERVICGLGEKIK